MAHRKTKTYRKYLQKHSPITRWWRRWEYKHTTLAILAIISFVLLLDTALVQALLLSVKELGLIGIFIAGILFVSFFTAAPAVAILIAVADNHPSWLIAGVAGVGSVIGDWVILKVLKDNVAYELTPLAKRLGLKPFLKLLQSKPLRPLAFTLGGLLIATPLPDEAGIALLGLSHFKTSRILLISFLLNAVGIYGLVWAARSILFQV